MGNHVYQYKKRSDTNTMSDLRKSYGGDEGIRTPGLCLAKAALSQLSHIPGRNARRLLCQIRFLSVNAYSPSSTWKNTVRAHSIGLALSGCISQ